MLLVYNKHKLKTKMNNSRQIAAIPGAQPKIPLILDEQGDFIIDYDYKYVLKRLNDGLTKRGNKVVYMEWNEDGTAKESHEEIKVGYSLLLDPRMSFAWLTTAITEILEQRDNYIRFNTQNSAYELTISK